MPKFKRGDRAYVPSSLLPNGDREIFAMRRCEVVATKGRSIQVGLPGGDSSPWIGSSKAHGRLGFALISIGDFESEEGLIDPLAKSILQFCRLLLPDDHIAAVKIRAIGELGKWWETNHRAYTHVVLIAHGDREAIYFGVDGGMKPASFEHHLRKHEASKKLFVSLCCETGKSPFAKEFSSLDFCQTFIAPEHSIHGAVGSQFLQTFLSLHLLQGKSPKVAFKRANALMPGDDSFAIWGNGASRS